MKPLIYVGLVISLFSAPFATLNASTIATTETTVTTTHSVCPPGCHESHAKPKHYRHASSSSSHQYQQLSQSYYSEQYSSFYSGDYSDNFNDTYVPPHRYSCLEDETHDSCSKAQDAPKSGCS